MRQVKRWMAILGLRRGDAGEGLPLINPAIPRKQLWRFIALYALFGIILIVLHHTVAPWL